MRRALALVAAGTLSVLGAGCGEVTGPGCDTVTDMRYNDVPTYLNDGSPVATFHFDQRYASSYDGRCGRQGGSVHLRVTSDAPFTQTFSFTARGINARGLVDWTVHGTVYSLGPWNTEDAGDIVYTTLPVDQGIQIEFSSWSSP